MKSINRMGRKEGAKNAKKIKNLHRGNPELHREHRGKGNQLFFSVNLCDPLCISL
jgi:hypothetical protein